jgi:hypothetical protein
MRFGMTTIRRVSSAGLFLAIGLAAVGGLQSARAADAKGSFAVHGVGALTCETVTGSLDKDAASMGPMLVSWLLGYVSAMNRTQPDVYDATVVQAPDVLANMVVNGCRKNAALRVETVAYGVLRILDPAKVRAESPEVEAKAGGKVATLRQETMAAVQRSLIDQKLLKGEADGKFGQSTEAALRTFQQQQNLPQTGLPDPATVVRILVELPARQTAPKN